MFPGIGALPKPATESHVVNRVTVTVIAVIQSIATGIADGFWSLPPSTNLLYHVDFP